MTETWFPIEIIRTKIERRQETLDAVLPHLEQLWAQHDALIPPWISSGGTYSTFPRNDKMDIAGKLLHEHPAMADAVEQIMIQVKEYWKVLGLDPSLTPVIQNMWAQRYIDGVGDKHNHPEFLIAGGLYLHVSGPQKIVFENPIALLYQPELVSAFDKDKLDVTIDLELSDLILWPGWMNHTITAEKPADWTSGPTRITLPFMVNGVRND